MPETVQSTPYVAAKETCILGESPIWSVAEQALYWVDIRNPMIHRLHPASGERRKWRVQTEIGSIGFATGNRLIAGTRMGFAFIDLADGGFEELADPEGDGRMNRVRLNDGKVDRQGRFWCGGIDDPGGREIASLYRFDSDRSVHRMAGPVQVSNCLAWSPDNKTMYFGDTRKLTVWAYDFDDQTGEIANRRTFLTFPEGVGAPDGATVDADGFVWVAHMRAGMVRRYDPAGMAEREYRFPASMTTCPALGGPDLTTLYVTTASMRFEAADFVREPDAGSVFAVETGVKGLPEPAFAG